MEQCRIVLSIFKVCVPAIQHDCQSVIHAHYCGRSDKQEAPCSVVQSKNQWAVRTRDVGFRFPHDSKTIARRAVDDLLHGAVVPSDPARM